VLRLVILATVCIGICGCRLQSTRFDWSFGQNSFAGSRSTFDDPRSTSIALRDPRADLIFARRRLPPEHVAVSYRYLRYPISIQEEFQHILSGSKLAVEIQPSTEATSHGRPPRRTRFARGEVDWGRAPEPSEVMPAEFLLDPATDRERST
jgi:hypothetical protein